MRSISQAAIASDATRDRSLLEQAKKHLEVPQAVQRHDDHVARLIVAARELWEHDTNSATYVRTVTERFKTVDEELRLSIRPVQSVTSVQLDGVDVTFDFDAATNQIYFEKSQTGEDFDSVVVVYEAGYTDVPQIVNQAILLQLEMMFEPSKVTKYHEQAYENLLSRYLRPSYP